MKISIGILAFILLILTKSQASSTGSKPFLTEFRRAGLYIPIELMKGGYSQIGPLTLEELMAKINAVTINPKDWFVVKYPDGTERISGFWHNGSIDSGIDFNLTAWQGTPPQTKPLVALHEYLCFFGFPDQDYKLSLSLWFFMDQIQRPFISKSALSQLKDNIIRLAAGGGAVGIGGGGDFGTLGLKQTILEDVKKTKTLTPEELEEKIMATYFFIVNSTMEFQWKRGR